MLKTYFIHIAAVRMAAVLTGRGLYDNYAFHGALERFAPLNIGEIKNADDVPDIIEKAESFRFGQACGKILAKELAGYDENELTLYEAAVAKGVFMKPAPETITEYPPEALKENIKTIFRALLKYAQIQTHTAKPGGEDINAWLAAYNGLLNGYEPCLNNMVDLIISANEVELKKMNEFFNRNDALTALAIKGGEPKSGELEKALSSEPVSIFGAILQKIILFKGASPKCIVQSKSPPT